jgi:hypothetical protein
MTTTDHTKTGLDEHLSYLKLVYMSGVSAPHAFHR